MREAVYKFAVAASVLSAAMSASAASAASEVTPATDPCTSTFVNGAVACQGYYGKNLFTGGVGSTTTAEQQSIINLLLTGTASTVDTTPTSNTGAYNPPYALDTSKVLGAVTNLKGSATVNFGALLMSGWTVFGAHFGNNIDSDSNNVSAFWLINAGSTPTNTITLSNGQGSSNAQIFATSSGLEVPNEVGPVPEPGTWAMMLFGFGAIGTSMRRRKPRHLLQQA